MSNEEMIERIRFLEAQVEKLDLSLQSDDALLERVRTDNGMLAYAIKELRAERESARTENERLKTETSAAYSDMDHMRWVAARSIAELEADLKAANSEVERLKADLAGIHEGEEYMKQRERADGLEGEVERLRNENAWLCGEAQSESDAHRRMLEMHNSAQDEADALRTENERLKAELCEATARARARARADTFNEWLEEADAANALLESWLEKDTTEATEAYLAGRPAGIPHVGSVSDFRAFSPCPSCGHVLRAHPDGTAMCSRCDWSGQPVTAPTRTVAEQAVLEASYRYAEASMPSDGTRRALLDAARGLRGRL